MELKDIKTCDLVAELQSREGVEVVHADAFVRISTFRISIQITAL